MYRLECWVASILFFFLIGLYIFRQYLHNEEISLISIIVLNSFFRLSFFILFMVSSALYKLSELNLFLSIFFFIYFQSLFRNLLISQDYKKYSDIFFHHFVIWVGFIHILIFHPRRICMCLM